MSDRRTFLQHIAAISFATPISAAAATTPQVRGYGEDMPDMLLAHLQSKTNALAAEWDRKRAQIRTPAALEERNRFVRARCTEMIHGLPERTPLNPVIVRVLEREGDRK